MKFLVTGAKGFIGKNLIAGLRSKGYHEIYEYDMDTPQALLQDWTKDCEFVYHLAGVNRPKEEKEFMDGNWGFTSLLLDSLKKNKNTAPVLITSSIQALLDNPYGKSKKAGEDVLFAYAQETGAKAFVYRLPNVFGKWCRPNYNSAIATFCNNIAKGLPITINDPEAVLKLVYIDDVVEEFIDLLLGQSDIKADGFCYVETVHIVKLGDVVKKLYAFEENRRTLKMPSLEEPFDKDLYSTYLSYLEEDNFSYPLIMHHDSRGWFSEFIKNDAFGQISISQTKPGITRGNHWHHTKVEKFLVVQGEAVIKFRKIDSDKVLEYNVSGKMLTPVDIPPGYTHQITNIGATDVITLFWSNESYNPEKPDTIFLEV